MFGGKEVLIDAANVGEALNGLTTHVELSVITTPVSIVAVE
jgi:hypothetical protein